MNRVASGFFAAITTISMMVSPAAAATASFDAAQRGQILDGISQDLNKYIFPEVAQKIRTDLTSNRERLVAITDPMQFAKSVSDELHAAGNDKHLNLIYSADLL